MYPSTIILALAAAVGLINAVAIPQPGNPEYDTCISEYGTVFEGAPSPEIFQCTGCFGEAFTKAFIVYAQNPNDMVAVKNEYNTEMAECNGPAEETYNTCVEEYAELFDGEPYPGPVECTGCAGKAFAAGFAAYTVSGGDVEFAKYRYDVEMEECIATS